MSLLSDLHFVDNPVVAGREDRYDTVEIHVDSVLESWRMSLFSYEWVRPDGQIKTLTELPPAEQPKRTAVEESLKNQTPLEKPVLGIGLLENVEIGSGRALFLTLAALGCKTLPVHIPKSNLKEFKGFIVKG